MGKKSKGGVGSNQYGTRGTPVVSNKAKAVAPRFDAALIDRLIEAASDEDRDARLMAAGHPQTPYGVLLVLAEDRDPKIAKAARSHKNFKTTR